MDTLFSIYIHIPFCRHRCCYCDFNTYAGIENRVPEYVSALAREIEFHQQAYGLNLPVHTIFIGGGTPSLIPAREYEKIMDALSRSFSLRQNLEITIEANPGTLSLDYLRDIRSLGINRISLGVQSARPDELRLLERQHDFLDVIHAVSWARQAGFDQLNLDLIFGLPHQEMVDWQQSLELSINLAPQHFSLYCLSFEHNTPMLHWLQRGLVQDPDPDLAADMYEWAIERLDAGGWNQYEISNWAEVGAHGMMSCRHNLQYWRNLPYLGIGAGAHGFAGGIRTANILSPAGYIEKLTPKREDNILCQFPSTPATHSTTQIDTDTEMAETMMMGLRLVDEGVSENEFKRRFNQEMIEIYSHVIPQLLNQRLVEWVDRSSDRSLRLTRRGRLLGNRVFVEFV